MVKVNGLEITDELVEVLKQLRDNNCDELSTHLDTTSNVQDFLAENVFNIGRNCEKEVLNYTVSLVGLKNCLKSLSQCLKQTNIDEDGH